MNRRDIVLTTLAAAEGGRFSPAQLQKALFLIDRNLPGIVNEGEGFHFKPYDYGPFDRAVYDEADALAVGELARVERSNFNGYRSYSATEAGLERSRALLAQAPNDKTDYIRTVARWVRSLSFAQLVKSIYEEYPEMRANSIFVE